MSHSLTPHILEHVVTTGDLEHVVEESDPAAGVDISESTRLSRKNQKRSRTLTSRQARAKSLETALERVCHLRPLPRVSCALAQRSDGVGDVRETCVRVRHDRDTRTFELRAGVCLARVQVIVNLFATIRLVLMPALP